MTEIRLWNTRTRAKDPLEPTVIPGRVSIYVCGPTVYDRAHLGNARPSVVFDVLNRLLRHTYGDANVTYVRNITDVEDKIIDRAAERGIGIDELTATTEAWYHQDMAALGVLPPDVEPHATAFIPQMIAMIETLVAQGHAYAAEGHVLFAVGSYADYGALSGRSVEDMIAGARVEVAPYKRDPMDFVLWKPSAPDQPGWDSPWGRGRPGWHIECSAMSHAILGDSFDIHGGGIDLQFPHHENEIAQSKCAHPEGAFARIWMHNEMLQVEGKKMSKSLGNFFTVRDLLDRGVPGEVIRFVFLSTHYRKPMDWTEKKRGEAEKRLTAWFRKTDGVEAAKVVPARVLAALADDLNTHLALTEMNSLSAPYLKAAMRLIGLPDAEEVDWFRYVESGGLAVGVNSEAATKIDELLARRSEAKNNRNFAEADRIRDALSEAGVVIKDVPGGSVWEFGMSVDLNKLEALK
ncbi:cysteine--tRNA ligase [Palleronia sp. KMU-117]|uniref:cysteine--tRNA ligase n=1 Tax=Palleronia sp. KMU-117 TaxID=3434108 RepID=UPI003D721074